MSTILDDTDSVFDLNEAVPETELLDNSIQKGRAQLSVKKRRQRSSRSRYHDSVSSNEGEDGLDRKSQDSPLHSAHSPLQLAAGGSAPSPDSLLASRSPAFSFDSPLVRRSAEEGGSSLAATPRGRYRQLTNATSQEALVTPSSSPSKSCPSSTCSPVYMRRNKRPDSEVLVSDSSPADPGSPVIFDKKTKRRFLDLGVTLRRSYVRVRKDKSNRLSVGSREPSESPSRTPAAFVPFSWFTEGRGSVSSSGTPPCSPKATPHGTQSPSRSRSQESTLSEEFSPRSPPDDASSPPADPSSSGRSSHPYHTLSQSSDEPFEEPGCAASSWTTAQVCQWLRGLSMEQYVPEFTSQDVDGRLLLQMDSARLKGLGVLNSSDRTTLKRRIKEIHTAVEKERKALDKFEKQKEKQQRKKDQDQRRN